MEVGLLLGATAIEDKLQVGVLTQLQTLLVQESSFGCLLETRKIRPSILGSRALLRDDTLKNHTPWVH